MKKTIISTLAITFLMFSSCTEDEPKSPEPEVNTPKKYEFTRNEKSTVDYSGQQTRLDMHSQLKSAIHNSVSKQVTLEHLNKMFNHNTNDADFADGMVFGKSKLNASSKNISGAVAYSKGYKEDVKTQFNNWFKEVADNSNPTAEATKGVSGYLDRKADGTKKILVDANGFEYTQVISKSLMGAMQLDQIVNKYLSAEKLDVKNDNNKEGKDYTEMEHHWDEAFGYTALHINSLDDNLERPSENRRFWGGYIYAVNGLVAGQGIKNEIITAFLKGRQAIAVKNYEVRDEQAEVIKKLMSKVCAIRAAYYLKAGKSNVLSTVNTDKADAFHAISEGYGFIYGLQFSNDGSGNPYFSKTEVDEMLTKLEENGGLYQENIETVLDELVSKIAVKFDFKVAGLNKV